jgi:hypothetical protein
MGSVLPQSILLADTDGERERGASLWRDWNEKKVSITPYNTVVASLGTFPKRLLVKIQV